MIMLVSVLAFGGWVYLVAFHGRFWRSSQRLREASPSGKSAVTVMVPARNEAETIEACLASLLAQDYPGRLKIMLVDDNSTDGTGEIASRLKAGEQLEIVKGEPLPPGWAGKVHAMHQGLSRSWARDADYVLFTDADIVHAPGHVSALVGKAEAESLDLVSEMVRLNCTTLAERAVVPAFVFFFQMLYPFDWVADGRKGVAGAAGGTMLVSHAALDRIDGVSRIANRLIDDCALAREIKRTGGRIWLGHSEEAVSIRVYATLGVLWRTIARTAYEQLGYSPWLLLGCVAGMGILYLAPPALSVFARGVAQWLGIAAWAMMAAAFQPTLRRYGRSPLWGVGLPAISLFYLSATVGSALQHYGRRGGGWKGRVYPG